MLISLDTISASYGAFTLQFSKSRLAILRLVSLTVLTFLFRSNRTDIGESSDLGLHHVETSSKRYINIKQNYKFFFQSFDEDFGLVKEEITNDNNILPKTQEGKIGLPP